MPWGSSSLQAFCLHLFPLSGKLFLVLQVSTYISPPPESLWYWYKTGRVLYFLLCVPVVPYCILVMVSITLYGHCLPACFFRLWHMTVERWTTPSSSCNSSDGSSTLAHGYWIHEWRMKNQKLWYLTTIIINSIHQCGQILFDSNFVLKLYLCISHSY